MSQDIKEILRETKEEEFKKSPKEEEEKLKEVLEKEIKPEEAKPLEEKPTPEEVKPATEKVLKIKPKRKRKPKPKPQILEAVQKWEEKWMKVKGENVLFVPSGFEIMTKNGWRPIMTRADKIQK